MITKIWSFPFFVFSLAIFWGLYSQVHHTVAYVWLALVIIVPPIYYVLVTNNRDRAKATTELTPGEITRVRELLQVERRDLAIDHVEKVTGLSRAEATDRVERIEERLAESARTGEAVNLTNLNLPGRAERGEIQALLADGKKIAAIKRTRELTGMGLAEAKNYVEALDRGQSSTVQPAATDELPPRIDGAGRAEILALVRDGKKISAVKRTRELTGMGLKDAKEYVESLQTGLS